MYMVAMITCTNYEPLGRSVFSVCTKVLNRKYYRLKTYGDKLHLCSPPPKTWGQGVLEDFIFWGGGLELFRETS